MYSMFAQHEYFAYSVTIFIESIDYSCISHEKINKTDENELFFLLILDFVIAKKKGKVDF